jgi:hypothetical protein
MYLFNSKMSAILVKKHDSYFQNRYLTQGVPYDDAKAGAAVAVQSFGLRLRFQPIGLPGRGGEPTPRGALQRVQCFKI